jgi:hypothetical protein
MELDLVFVGEVVTDFETIELKVFVGVLETDLERCALEV